MFDGEWPHPWLLTGPRERKHGQGSGGAQGKRKGGGGGGVVCGEVSRRRVSEFDVVTGGKGVVSMGMCVRMVTLLGSCSLLPTLARNWAGSFFPYLVSEKHAKGRRNPNMLFEKKLIKKH